MSYQEAFQAVNCGDFAAAVPLLEKAAEETQYSSDIINHTYTLALYRVGARKRLADVAFKIGSLLVESDPGSAMDYFQRAFLGDLEAAKTRSIAEVFERWARPKSADAIDTQVQRVAHVVGSIHTGHAPAAYVKLLSGVLRKHGVDSRIFTTESNASWFLNPAGRPLSVESEADEGTRIASVDGDFSERAERIADAIRASGVQVALFHGGLDEQITARVASLRPSPIQIQVNHKGGVDSSRFDGHVHLHRNALERSHHSDSPSEWIPPASDILERLRAIASSTRQAMGLESASSVSATFGDLSGVSGAGYMRALGDILQRFPKHFHLFAGPGDVKAVRAYLHAEGVLPRVRFLGQMGDVAAVLGVIDLYLAPFPNAAGSGVLEAMGAGKPVVVLQYPPDSPYNAGAELVGIPELTASGEAGYLEIANRLIRDKDARARLAAAVESRFSAEFDPSCMVPRYLTFIGRVISCR